MNLTKESQKRPATLDDLKTTELFKEIDEDALSQLLPSSAVCEIAAHERLILTKDGVDYVFIILRGYVGIWLSSRFISRRETFAAWRGPGQIVGEMTAIGDARSEVRISTSEPCSVIELRSDALTDVANSLPKLYRNICRLLVKKLYQERHRSEVIQTSTTARKVAQTLLHLADERLNQNRKNTLMEKKGHVIPGLIIQDEIAAYIGAKRETVNRKLSEFKRTKIITYVKSKKGSQITILDYKKLLNIAKS